MTTSAFLLRLSSSHRSIPKWVIGVAVATPIMALAQGCVMLDEFRQLHGHAPRPVIPSRGVVVVRSNDDDNDTNDTDEHAVDENDSVRGKDAVVIHHHQLEPLRLLVIGDSLAAGVGVTSSGTPVLPEAIAKALSRALNGRPVFWTCVGTPGASSAQIVQELHDMEEERNKHHHHHDETPTATTSATTTAANNDVTDNDHKPRDGRADDNEKMGLEAKFAEWKKMFYKQQLLPKQGPGENDSLTAVDADAPATEKVKNPISRWVTTIQGRVKDLTKNKIDQVTQQIILNRRRTNNSVATAAETAIVSQYVSQYDIAVVMTGLNDLKKEYLPFMMTENQKKVEAEYRAADKTSISITTTNISDEDNDVALPSDDTRAIVPESTTTSSSSKKHDSLEDFSNIVAAVKRKMKPGRPLVVFPAIPTASAPVFQLAPLNWFLVPLLSKIDQHKKALAAKFPELVLFVEAPSIHVLSEFEAQRGPLWTNRQTEQVLLKLTDVGHNVREKVEQLMKQHYQAWTKDAEEGDDKKPPSRQDDDDDDDSRLFRNDDTSHVELLISSNSNNNNKAGVSSRKPRPGSTLIAPDKVHPNDLGYDIWGRHIAAAIVHRMMDTSSSS